METSDLLVVCDWTPGTGHWREGWSTVMERSGEQSVTTTSTTLMLGLSADRLDFLKVIILLFSILHYFIFILCSDGALAFSGRTSPYGRAASGVPVYLDQIACTGVETSLEQCSFTGVGMVSGCGHSQDSAVSCQIRQCKYSLALLLCTTHCGLYCMRNDCAL